MEASHAHGHAHSVAPAGVLREHGRRLTVQRAVIWEILTAEPDAHLSAEEIAARVHERMPRVNASTVYRNLDVLAEDGLVRRTDLGGNRTFFEPVREHRHHHVVCERCGRVDHVHDHVLADLARHVRAHSGFELGERELTLFGLCRACAAQPRGAGGSGERSERLP